VDREVAMGFNIGHREHFMRVAGRTIRAMDLED